MLVEALVLSILVGKLRGFSLRNLESIQFRKWWLVFISFGIEALASIILKTESLSYLHEVINSNYFIIHVIIYILLFIFLIVNIDFKAFYLIILGSIMNFAVIITNKGFMPVDTSLAEAMGFNKTTSMLLEGKVAGHSLMTQNTPLWFLGDIINIPPPYPFPQTISIGDIFLCIGIFIFIQNQMRVNNKPRG